MISVTAFQPQVFQHHRSQLDMAVSILPSSSTPHPQTLPFCTEQPFLCVVIPIFLNLSEEKSIWLSQLTVGRCPLNTTFCVVFSSMSSRALREVGVLLPVGGLWSPAPTSLLHITSWCCATVPPHSLTNLSTCLTFSFV